MERATIGFDELRRLSREQPKRLPQFVEYLGKFYCRSKGYYKMIRNFPPPNERVIVVVIPGDSPLVPASVTEPDTRPESDTEGSLT